jgi:hypothetical protein
MDLDTVDEKTAFKLGFAASCAEQGLSVEDVDALVKSAAPAWLSAVLPALRSAAGRAATAGGEAAGRLGSSLWRNAVPAATAAGAGVAGGLAATGGAALQSTPAVAQHLALLAAGAPVAAGLALGGGLGYGAAKFNEPDLSPEDIQAKEIADTYKTYTNRLRARRAYQQYREARN